MFDLSFGLTIDSPALSPHNIGVDRVAAVDIFQVGPAPQLRSNAWLCVMSAKDELVDELKIGNRRLWVNSVIGALQAELEIVRQDNLASRSAENIDDTRERLDCLLEGYKTKLNYRPFTIERKDA